MQSSSYLERLFSGLRMSATTVAAGTAIAAAPVFVLAAPPPPSGPPQVQPANTAGSDLVTQVRKPRPGPDLPESDPRLPQMPTVPNFTGEQR